jgi:galactokinase
MPLRLKIPARVNVLGNPSDANEGDFATISAAVNIYAHGMVAEASGIVLEQLEITLEGLKASCTRTFSPADIPLPYDGSLDLVKGGINRLWAYSPELREKLARRGIRIATWSEVPRQSGLGGSTLFVLLTLAGLRAFYELDPHLHNDYVLAELTQRVEACELGITCGYADRYAPLFGGLAYLDYRGKLHQQPLHAEPYATYERLDPWVNNLPWVAISSGIPHDSGDVHGQMRPRYLQEHDAWVAMGGEAPAMVRFMRGAYETAWRGKIALLCRDWEAFGALMNENHHRVNEMMRYCGFTEGAGWANNLLIETALAHGALGAKLTGAGGGGSVFALTRPGAEQQLAAAWQQAAQEAGLQAAQIFYPKIARQGLVVEAFQEQGECLCKQ